MEAAPRLPFSPRGRKSPTTLAKVFARCNAGNKEWGYLFVVRMGGGTAWFWPTVMKLMLGRALTLKERVNLSWKHCVKRTPRLGRKSNSCVSVLRYFHPVKTLC